MQTVSSEYLIVVRNDGTKHGTSPFLNPYAVERSTYDDGSVHWLEGSGVIRSAVREASGQAQGYALRSPKNAAERRAVQMLADACAYENEKYRLRRWSKRDGTTVEWGNVIGGMSGQSFRETFATEAEAIERQRQADACESIGVEREPIAVERVNLRG